MRRFSAILSAIPLSLLAAPAHAGDVPLYQPVPAWVAQAPAPDPATLASGPTILIYDQQVRIEGGTAQIYFDNAVRADKPGALTQLGTLAGVWSPDKGDLIVHRAAILRGGQEIDLLAGGRTFSVLQREKGLERRVLDGMLTATLPVTGLQVGDVVRFTYSVVRRDGALRGHAQEIRSLIARPAPVGFGRLRLSWPRGEPVQWKVGPKVTVPDGATKAEGDDTVVTMPLPLAKRDPMPDDAPFRFRRTPVVQIGNFADWREVSRTMAPLFDTTGLIAPGSPIAAETDAIARATRDPRERAARALELVQSRISYLLLGMNGGNYVPQTPAETWEKRYGDCKAKTLLLLSMLRRLGIEAEPALAVLKGGDALRDALPTVAAFDHVLVRATIGGRELWLDGTLTGTRVGDLEDVPALYYVLPLRADGADLMPVTWRKPLRPNLRVTMTLDQRGGIDLPVLVDLRMDFKGAAGAAVALAYAQTPPEKQDDIARNAVKGLFDDFQLTSSALATDEAQGITTIRATGLVSTQWRFDRGGARLPLEVGRNSVRFAPSRARPIWRDLPVTVAGPESTEWAVTIRLPDGGKGYVLEGAPTFAGSLGGLQFERNAELVRGDVILRGRRDAPAGAEVAPGEVAAEKAKVARFLASAPTVRAPTGARRYWETDVADRAAFAAYDTAYARAIEAKPDEARPYAARARFRRATQDRAGAFADFARAIDIEPSVALYSDRATMLEDDGKYEDALADILAALDIEPANTALALRRAHLLVKLGRRDEALAVRQDALGDAGTDGPKVVGLFGEVQAEAGDVAGAIAALDAAAAKRPGSADILNERCWIKATRKVDLDGAVRDCTRAIELADSPAAPLDSRAMAYYRLGKLAEARADLDAALDASPALAGSLFMRGVIRAEQGETDAARTDLARARRLSPAIDRQYGEWGITAPF